MLSKESAHNLMNEDGQTALHLAAMKDVRLTREVLAHGFNINIRNLNGGTPLRCAVNIENIETVVLLLRSHADTNAVDDMQEACLHVAARKDKTGLMTQLLLNRNADMELVDDNGLTPLLGAAFHGNNLTSFQLLQNAPNPQASEGGGFTAAHYAAMHNDHALVSRLLHPRGPDFEAFYERSGHSFSEQRSCTIVSYQRANIIRMLSEHGADIHISNKGFTPLQIAAVTAQDPVVNALLEQGASAQGATVICAYWGLDPATVDLLLERGANLEATDVKHKKPGLTWTAEIGSLDTLKVLLRHGANMHHQDNYGSSALHYAGANARTEFVKLLLESGAEPNLRDKEGRTALARLASAGRFYLAGRWWDPTSTDRKNTAIFLLEAGCDPSVKDVHGRAAVFHAASNGYMGILEAIGARGGDLEVLDGKGSTPLACAQERGQMDTVRFLRRARVMREKEEKQRE